MSRWKDETTYSRGARSRDARILAMGLAPCGKLIVHRLIHARDRWFFSIKWRGSYLIENQELSVVNIDDAKDEAMRKAGDLLHQWAIGLDMASQALKELVVD